LKKNIVQKITTCIFTFNILSPENHAIYVNMKKYGAARQATDDIRQHRRNAICMPDS
jgi:hypothetical protein